MNDLNRQGVDIIVCGPGKTHKGPLAAGGSWQKKFLMVFVSTKPDHTFSETEGSIGFI